MNFALERARGNIPPAFASPLELRGAGATVVPARKRQPVQARRNEMRKPAPKSRNSGGTRSIGQGLEASASFVGGQPTFLLGSVVFLQRPQGKVAPDTSIDYGRLLAATCRLLRRKRMTLLSRSGSWISRVKYCN